MKHEEIIKLLDAGYTKEEITEMLKTDESGESPEEEKTPNSPEEETPVTTSESSKIITEALSEIKDIFSDFKKELTAINILNSNIPQNTETTEDIIGKIINPFED